MSRLSIREILTFSACVSVLLLAFGEAGCASPARGPSTAPVGRSQHQGFDGEGGSDDEEIKQGRRTDEKAGEGSPDSAAAPRGGDDEKSEKVEPRKPHLKRIARMKLQLGGDEPVSVAATKGRVAVGTKQGRLVLLDAKSGAVQWTSEAKRQQLRDIRFSADGSAILATGELLSNFVWRIRKNKARFYRVWHRKHGDDQALSRTGRMLIREDARGSVRWYELSTYKMKWLVKASTIATSGNGRIVACRSWKGAIEIRGSKRGRLRHKIEGVGKNALLALDRDGRRLVHTVAGENEYRLRVVDTTSGEEIFLSEPLPSRPTSLTVTGSPALAVAWSKKSIAVIDIDNKTKVLTRKGPHGLIAPHGSKIYEVIKNQPQLIVFSVERPSKSGDSGEARAETGSTSAKRP
jgi:hypothetical protein